MQTIEKFYYDILKEQATKNPDREAIVMGDVRLTYKEFLHKVDQVAATLLSMKLQKGDKVVLWADTSPKWHFVYYGILRSGGIAVILNTKLTLQEAKPLIEFADSKYVIYGKVHDLAGTSEDAKTLSEIFNIPIENCVSMVDNDFSNAPDIKPDTTGWNVHDDAYII